MSSWRREKSPVFLSNFSVGPVILSESFLSVSVLTWSPAQRGDVEALSSNPLQSAFGFPPVQGTNSLYLLWICPPIVGLSGMKTTVVGSPWSPIFVLLSFPLLLDDLLSFASSLGGDSTINGGGRGRGGRCWSCARSNNSLRRGEGWSSAWFGAGSTAWGSVVSSREASVLSNLEIQSKLPGPDEVGDTSSAVVSSSRVTNLVSPFQS